MDSADTVVVTPPDSRMTFMPVVTGQHGALDGGHGNVKLPLGVLTVHQ